ncbi:hypothetical protein FACS189456_1170 [Bacteroidia bacterium]|nr:hypothetical protein FACS189456_1170 [Bacteroidia bacterium]
MATPNLPLQGGGCNAGKKAQVFFAKLFGKWEKFCTFAETIQQMKRNHIQHTIATYLQHQPVDKAWLFGSYARGEATRHSDVDILVKFIPNNKVSLLDYAHMMNELQRLLHKKVDLVEDGCLCAFAEDSVNHDKILIYERTAER